MREQEPLESWLMVLGEDQRHTRVSENEYDQQALRNLAWVLATSPPGRIDYSRSKGPFPSEYARTGFRPNQTAEAERMFMQVWERGGSGSTFVLGGLLNGIALARSPASIPFWRQQLDLRRPRDQTTTRRRTRALAALALLAITRNDAEAYAALDEALANGDEHVRATAIFYLRLAYGVPERPAPEHVVARLQALAAGDASFEPRYRAREALRTLGHVLPLDNPNSAFVLRVRLPPDPATRTIAILSEQTLDELHDSIQQAFEWDDDHLYSFYMNGTRDTYGYEIRCPTFADDWDAGIFSAITIDQSGNISFAHSAELGTEDDVGDEDDEQGEVYTSNACIGALGLAPKHTFMYLFDYGDQHEFDVTVLRIEPRDTGDYPRIIEAKGEAPAQYWYGDEDEDWSEE